MPRGNEFFYTGCLSFKESLIVVLVKFSTEIIPVSKPDSEHIVRRQTKTISRRTGHGLHDSLKRS